MAVEHIFVIITMVVDDIYNFKSLNNNIHMHGIIGSESNKIKAWGWLKCHGSHYSEPPIFYLEK